MRKRRAKQKTEMSEHEKNMVATRQFMNRLPNKKYFSRFRNKQEGIPEVNPKEEDTQTVDESEVDAPEKKKARKKKRARAGSPKSDADASSAAEGGEGQSDGE